MKCEIDLQIKSLQDTVQKECEERFELTEALSVAKEELLLLKKPAGNTLRPYVIFEVFQYTCHIA